MEKFDNRTYWCDLAYRIAYPVLGALSRQQLKATMPTELSTGYIVQNIDKITTEVHKKMTLKTKKLESELASLQKNLNSHRIDIKNFGNSDNDIEILGNTGKVTKPAWLANNQGSGAVIENDANPSKFKIKAIKDGKLVLSFRGQDKRHNNERYPVWIDYKSIKVDGKELLSQFVATWHDKPYKFEMPVKDGQVINLEVEQEYHQYSETELKDIILKLVLNEKRECSYLEALGRTLCGIAPWLELPFDDTEEGKRRQELLESAHKGIHNMVDATSADYVDFSKPNQALVDAAFLAQSFLRSPNNLWGGLDKETQQMVLKSLRSSRNITPYYNNWLLFSATIEAFFLSNDEQWDKMRVEYAVKKHHEWYKGDGAYGDGPDFHWDYYNSFVIQPMMVDIHMAMFKKKTMCGGRFANCIKSCYSFCRSSRTFYFSRRNISPYWAFTVLPYRKYASFRSDGFNA